MALARRFLLIGDAFLNNQFVEKGAVILWDPDKANNAMVPCDAKGRPLERPVAIEEEPVQILNIDPQPAQPEKVQLDDNQRANAILVAVRDVLEADNDSDWTQKGEIRIDVIRRATDLEDVTREEIEAAQAAIQEDEQELEETNTAKAKAAEGAKE